MRKGRVKQLRFLLSDLSYYRKNLADNTKNSRSITSLLKKGMEIAFRLAMETIVRKALDEPATPPPLVCPNWDVVADNYRPFPMYVLRC